MEIISHLQSLEALQQQSLAIIAEWDRNQWVFKEVPRLPFQAASVAPDVHNFKSATVHAWATFQETENPHFGTLEFALWRSTVTSCLIDLENVWAKKIVAKKSRNVSKCSCGAREFKQTRAALFQVHWPPMPYSASKQIPARKVLKLGGAKVARRQTFCETYSQSSPVWNKYFASMLGTISF